jgi:hypothetical protein
MEGQVQTTGNKKSQDSWPRDGIRVYPSIRLPTLGFVLVS